MADYEEQVLITGIKSGRQCSICTGPPNERGNLRGKWCHRTHASTQAQIARQEKEDIPEEDDNWVHPVQNFAWSHPMVNIHDAMLVDILHQLLKGTVEHLLKWLGQTIADALPAARKSKGQKAKLKDASGMDQLDERFRAVPAFPDLKIYNQYSAVAQWTGKDRRSIVRQLIPVIAPLLAHQYSDEMKCARALVDFVLMAQYHSHDDDTLVYLEDALYRFNELKECFSRFRVSKNNEHGHFNIPKLHAMTHYVEQIRSMGACDNYNSENGELAHHNIIKPLFELTNKREDWREQVVTHAIRYLNMLAMEDVLLQNVTRPSKLNSAALKPKVPTLCREVSLADLNADPDLHQEQVILGMGYNPRYWCRPSMLQQLLGLNGLLAALATFVRQCRNEEDNDRATSHTTDKRETDPSWVDTCLVRVHPSLICWKPNGRDPEDPDNLVPDRVVCSANWQNQGKWRRDHVLIVEEQPQSHLASLHGHRPAQVQILLTIADTERRKSGGKHRQYYGALVDFLKIRHGGKPARTHGMVELEPWPASSATQRRTLGARQFVPIPRVRRSVHIVPAYTGKTVGKDDVLYINNYADWDIYNSIYDEQSLLSIKVASTPEKVANLAGLSSRNARTS